MRQLYFTFIFLLICPFFSFSQKHFTRHDTIRGSLNNYRKSFDVYFYDLHISIDPEKKIISGSNSIHFRATENCQIIQVDLFKNLVIDSILALGKNLNYTRDSNAIFVTLSVPLQTNSLLQVQVFYHGHPIAAKNPPWDGGFVWAKDSLGRTFASVACEGIGASLWWPNKDHLSDEPDSMRMCFDVSKNLVCISNGNLRSKKSISSEKVSYEWFVSYPINNYDVSFYLGHYLNLTTYFSRSYTDSLRIDFYILDYNVEKATKHFLQVKKVLSCYEIFFGKYPFNNDGYALVDAPYWGMEHQGAIAYGNNYHRDVGEFDFIIIHESAHEWWGNSISVADHADMWVHEAFATYAEALLLECAYGYQTSLKYLLYQKSLIKNKFPVQGPSGVNFNNWPDTDMYYKGAWMLHTIRNIIGNDSLWFRLLKELSIQFKISTVTSQDIINFIIEKTGINLSSFFLQYLDHPDLPTLTYSLIKSHKSWVLKFAWKADVANFQIPFEIVADGESKRIPSLPHGELLLKIKKIKSFKIADDLFYITTKRIFPE